MLLKPLNYWPAILDMFYPRVCPACCKPLSSGEKFICIFCEFKLPKTNFIDLNSNPVTEIFRGRVSIEQANAWLYFRKEGMGQRLMHDIKYNGNSELGHYLGLLFGKDLLQSENLILPDLVIPVPLHFKKKKIRGFNQSEQIGKGISDQLGLKYDTELLIRLENSDTQTKKKRFERWENSVKSFVVNDSVQNMPEHVAIVDDVLTTGATLEACAQALIERGCRRVSFFCLCLAIN